MNITSVTTRTYAMDKNTLFRLSLMLLFKRGWWGILIVVAIIVANSWNDRNDPVTMAISVGVGILVGSGALIWSIWRNLSKKENRAFYLDRHYVIDTEKISGYSDDGASVSYPIKNLVRARLVQDYYFIHVTKMQQIVIPASAFKDAEDRQWFDTNVIEKVKNLRASGKKLTVTWKN